MLGGGWWWYVSVGGVADHCVFMACFRGWIHDRELQTTARISERVKIITGLEVDQRDPTGPSSAEAMQVTVLLLSLSDSLSVSHCQSVYLSVYL